MAEKRLGETITTVGDLRNALSGVADGIQVYVMRMDESSMVEVVEVTELLLCLPKQEDETGPFLLLYCE